MQYVVTTFTWCSAIQNPLSQVKPSHVQFHSSLPSLHSGTQLHLTSLPLNKRVANIALSLEIMNFL